MAMIETVDNFKIIIDKYELVESKVVNAFMNEFAVQVENLLLKFEFSKKHSKGLADIKKTEIGDSAVYDIKIFYSDLKIQGVVDPIAIGELDKHMYYFSIIGLHHVGKIRTVIFNLFRRHS